MSPADDPTTWAILATSLIASLGNAIVLVIKQVQQGKVNRAASNDLTTIAEQSPNVDAGQLETPKLVPGTPDRGGDTPPPPAPPVPPPAG